jgi:tellurite resistance protein TehA-like permease
MTGPAPAPGRLAVMHPAYFALVMATGIVSIACRLLGLEPIAWALFALNLAFYPLLWILTIARVVRHRQLVIDDLFHHGRSVGFFTVIAATSVLGSQCLIIGESEAAARALWFAGLGLWAVITYTVFTILVIKPTKPALADGINGGWLVAVVAAQSVCVLGAQLAPHFGASAPTVLIVCLAMWLGGGMLYFWIISLIFYRYAFFPMSPGDLAPPYWINMGAAAISTLAGATLIMAAPHSPLIEQILPFVRGFTLMWWATATWWIPMLVILGVWRHLYRRFPLGYDPLYWGAVFPLGMYTVCTARLSAAVDAGSLLSISRGFVYIAIAAWLAVAAGMVRSLVRRSGS